MHYGSHEIIFNLILNNTDVYTQKEFIAGKIVSKLLSNINSFSVF